MNFLGIGPGELLLIMILALIVFGPGKMPEIGAGLGKAIREFRRATSEITEEFTREMSLETPPQQAPTAEPAPPAVTEEPHPVAAPLDQELHPPAPIPVEPAPAQPEAAEAPSTGEATPAAAPPRRIRRVRLAGNGDAAATPGLSAEGGNGTEPAPAEAGGSSMTAVQKARRLRAARAAAKGATEAGAPEAAEAPATAE